MRYGFVCSGVVVMFIEELVLCSWQCLFFKWVGGKYLLLLELDCLIFVGKCFIEFFVGGGLVFFNLDKYECFFLVDVSVDLINLYQMLVVVFDLVIYEVMKVFRYFNDVENYMLICEVFNVQWLDVVECVVVFFYFNWYCFNGLICYNLDGFF